MKYWQTYIFLLSALLSSGHARATSDTLLLQRMADSLLAGGQYYAAGIYYQKLGYFAQGAELKNQARFATAGCYKLSGNFREGIEQLNGIPLEEASAALITEVKYQCALLCYLDSDPARAESYLQQLAYLVKDSSYIHKTLLLHVLVLNELYRWPEAKQKLSALNNSFDLTTQAANRILIDSLYNEGLIPRLKNSEKAGRMSTFFPGLGQFYTKNYGEGAFSFLSITACAGAAVVGIIYQYYFTSIFVGNLVIGKLYLGGIKRAEFLADRYNYRKAKDYNSFLKTRIRQHFTPITK